MLCQVPIALLAKSWAQCDKWAERFILCLKPKRKPAQRGGQTGSDYLVILLFVLFNREPEEFLVWV